MSILYLLLAATSLSVKLATGNAPPGMLSHQVNAWWRIFPIVSLALLTYPMGPAALACLVFVLAMLELAAHHEGPRTHFWAGASIIVLGIACIAWQLPSAAPLLLAGAVALHALYCALRFSRNTLICLLILITAGAMFILAMFPALPFGARTNLSWLFYLFILTALNDIAQFISGKLFGRHKIAPTISPNKTWQGLAGGILVSQLVSVVLGTYLSLASPSRLALFALLLSIAGFAGDLMFSAAKRSLAIKDFSTLIPGHGGILDRADSLVLTAPLLYWLLSSIE